MCTGEERHQPRERSCGCRRANSVGLSSLKGRPSVSGCCMTHRRRAATTSSSSSLHPLVSASPVTRGFVGCCRSIVLGNSCRKRSSRASRPLEVVTSKCTADAVALSELVPFAMVIPELVLSLAGEEAVPVAVLASSGGMVTTTTGGVDVRPGELPVGPPFDSLGFTGPAAFRSGAASLVFAVPAAGDEQSGPTAAAGTPPASRVIAVAVVGLASSITSGRTAAVTIAGRSSLPELPAAAVAAVVAAAVGRRAPWLVRAMTIDDRNVSNGATSAVTTPSAAAGGVGPPWGTTTAAPASAISARHRPRDVCGVCARSVA